MEEVEASACRRLCRRCSRRNVRTVLVGLQTIDGDGEAALFALDRGDFIPDRSDLGQDLVHAGLEVGGGECVAHRRGGDGDA